MRRLILALASLFISVPLFAAVSGSLIDTDGQPVSGAKVSIFAPETYEARRVRIESKTPDRTPLASATSNAKGIFSFDPPKLPVFVIAVDASGFAPAQTEEAAGDDIGTIALTKAETKQGKVTADGKPVANAFVWWLGSNGAEVAAHTDEQGRYSVPDPSKWTARLLVLHPDYAMVAKIITPIEKSVSPDVTLTSGIALAGGVVAEDGQTPVAKATIGIFGFTVANAGDDGRFKIAHAPKQWDSLTATAGDRIGSVTQVSKGTTIRLGKGAFITGSIHDMKARLPLAAAGVVANVGRNMFFAQASPSSALTDAKGNFSIGPLPAGSYNLGMQRPGYAGSMSTISLMPGQKVSRALVAIPVARVSGVVIDESKAPVAGAVVTTREVSRAGRMGMFQMAMPMQGERTTWTGGDGRFSAVATEGDAQIEAVRRGWPAARSATIHLAAGDRKSGVVITVPRGVEVTGKVVDQNGKPVSGVAVIGSEAAQGGGFGFARRVIARGGARDNNDTAVRTAADGTFAIRVKEGLYDFAFQRSGFSQHLLRGQQVTASTKPLTVTLDPSVEITGRVVRGSTPLAGATVYAASGSGDASSAITAADGSFLLADLSAGPMMVLVNKPDEMAQTMKPVTAPAKDIVIELPSVSRVSGRVVDKGTNKPVTTFEAGVSVPRGGGGMMVVMPPMMQTFTSDDGSFTLENVPVGQTQIVANAPGYTMSRVSTTVEEGKAVTGLEIGLEAGAKLTGHVTGPDGSPLAGAIVRPEMTGGRGVMRMPTTDTATTDGNGEYSLDSLEPGDHSFSFTYSSLPPVSKSVTLSGRETRLDVQFTNGLTVAGMVVTDAGVPVADAQVRASSAAEGGPMNASSTRTDASGGFVIEGLAPGHYMFAATKSGYAEGILRDVDISSGAPVRVTMKSGGVITGHVTGVSATELAQTNVMASSASGSANAPVDSSGNYRIDGAPIGTVRVQANVQMGMTGGRTSAPKMIQVDTGGTAQADLEFQSGTVVRGRITRAGMPLDGSMVMFAPRDGKAQTNARTTTASDGSYSVTGLDDGSYMVQITDIGRSVSYSSHYDVHGSGTFDVDMKLTSVRGHVVDSSTGEAIANATVEVRSTGGGGFMTSRPAMTDSNGYYSLDSVAPGSYQASASKEGYGNNMQDLSVSDSAVDLDFKLTPQAGVTLTVIDARDRRVLAPNVHVFDGSGRDVYDTRFDFGTAAEPAKLPLSPGSYRAIVSAQGYAPQTITITSPSQPTVALTPGGTIVIHNRNNTPTRARLVGADGTPYSRFGMNGTFSLNAAPLPTTIPNVASATYTLQLLDVAGQVVSSTTVTVVDGGIADVNP